MRLAHLLTVMLVANVCSAADYADPKHLDVPEKTVRRSVELVCVLYTDDVKARNAAVAELGALGREAYPALWVASKLNPPDPIRGWVTKALVQARELDFEARADVFLADEKAKYKHHFFGWSTLVAIAGDTPETRTMFTAILKNADCRNLLIEAAKPPTAEDAEANKKGKHRLTLRWQAHLHWMYQADLIEVVNPRAKANVPITWLCAGLLADLEHPVGYYNWNTLTVGQFLLATDEGQDAIRGEGKYGGAFLKLFHQWADNDHWSDGASLYRYMGNQPERYRACLVRIAKYVRGRGAVPYHELEDMAKVGDAEAVACLRSFLDQEVVVNPHRLPGDPAIEGRDIALACCIEVSGQEVGNYGLSKTGNHNFRYWFSGDKEQSSEEKREAGFKKWAEWEKAHPEFLKGKPLAKKDAPKAKPPEGK